VFAASGALGVKVAVVPAAFSTRVPGTGVLPARTWKVVDPTSTARSKPTDTVEPRATPVAPDAGVRVVTAGVGAFVVNDHETGIINAPAALVAPDAVTVYVLPLLSAADGVNVATLVVALYAVEPATGVPPGFVTTMVAPVTAWSNPTATVVVTATLVAPGAGVCEVTVGRAAVVNVHETAVMTPPPAAVAPETVTV
jgi:hypothetical protein